MAYPVSGRTLLPRIYFVLGIILHSTVLLHGSDAEYGPQVGLERWWAAIEVSAKARESRQISHSSSNAGKQVSNNTRRTRCTYLPVWLPYRHVWALVIMAATDILVASACPKTWCFSDIRSKRQTEYSLPILEYSYT